MYLTYQGEDLSKFFKMKFSLDLQSTFQLDNSGGAPSKNLEGVGANSNVVVIICPTGLDRVITG